MVDSTVPASIFYVKHVPDISTEQCEPNYAVPLVQTGPAQQQVEAPFKLVISL